MAQAGNSELVDSFEQFFRNYYDNEIKQLAQRYPNEQRSLHVDWQDLYRFDPDLADDFIAQPEQLQRYAEESLRLYDLPIDVSLGQAHVRIRNLPETESPEIREIRARDMNSLVQVHGIVRKATDVRPKIEEAAFECQLCGTLTRVPQSSGDFQEPHECQGCERQGPFRVNFDQSEFVDSQKLRIQESPEGLRGGETPQSLDVHVEDDITGEVTPGDHVSATGVLRLEQQGDQQEKSPVFDFYMEGMSVDVDEEQFEDMDITEEDKKAIYEISNQDDVYEHMIASIAPSIYGYDQEKLAMILQLFSGVTKQLPDGSRIRGDLHMLLIGDPGTGKCVRGDTKVTLADGRDVQIRELVESNLTDPKPIDDGWYDEIDLNVPSLQTDGSIAPQRATKVWKREAPDEMYRIKTSSGRELEVTPSHPLFVPVLDRYQPVRAEELSVGDLVAETAGGSEPIREPTVGAEPAVTDGGTTVEFQNIETARITSTEWLEPDYDWVYDLEVEGTHNYISNGVISHNSQMLGYIENIAPRSVYTSGKGSSSAGLTAAAVRDDFGDGQQWSLEAGALVLADQGIAAVDELDKMRCVTGDTLVHTGNGIKPIRELAHEAIADGSIESLENGRTIRNVNADVWTMSGDGNIVKRDVLAIHEYDAPDELHEIELESGERLTTTADHPFFVLEDGVREERQAQQLDVRDWIYVPRTVPTEATDGGTSVLPPSATDFEPTQLSAPHGSILGYIAGDGNIYYNQDDGSYGFRFTTKEEELLSNFEEACMEAFGTRAVRHPSEKRDDGVETLRVHGKKYVDELLDLGANLETYDGKLLPETVSGASRKTKAAFVRALADSEATVDERAVKIYASSYELLLGTKMLLLEFGISSQIQTRNRDGKRDLFVLAITSNQSLETFERHIGFTLDRKHRALERACERTNGTRTVLDVLPECGELFEQARGALRLHQSECGLESDATYYNFENGDANASIRLSKAILETFENRKAAAKDHRKELISETSWDRLAELRERYHVSQRELATEMSLSQQQLSAQWGSDTVLRKRVRNRLRDLLATPASVNLNTLRTLIESDTKWRRVTAVNSVEAREHSDARVEILEQRLADEIGSSTIDSIREQARSLLGTDESAETWDELRDCLETHGISFQQVAAEMDVAGSTVSRWFSGTVDIDNFETVRSACEELCEEKRQGVSELLEEIERRTQRRVYDLTVEGTHNFIANGMVVHNSEDRSAMHEALEQQKISVSKAGINATLKSRCSLLGAANPKYGRFDQYEPISEQIDLEPALISRFDLIFTVTDTPDEEKDRNLAEHIITTNYAGELTTQREQLASLEVSTDEIDEMTAKVDPEIDAELLRKYIAFSKQNCHPRMTEEAREAIRDFYVDLRSKGTDDDAAVPVTARKLEALVRLSEASARVRLSDTVEQSDAERVIEIVRSCLQDVGVDPETGEFDADIVEAGTSKSQRDRIKNLKQLIGDIEEEYDDGAPVDIVLERAEEVGMDHSKAEHEIDKLKQKGEVYEPSTDTLRTT
ncbi:LAGLIDADG family homing endonuclease [Natrinema gelatinilyticum]|uniref:LAGLIDADG family homing endonuclease n=1 Tax=Natrinema gelatinilyticum TaxID=2961571 RepID=UPI0020C4B74B|nr:LAGLIDADG family homing endonuclease [Natrinema gelatinilyticum]